MENLKDVINMPQMAEIGDNPPTAMWLSDAASITNGNLHIPDYVYNYKRSAATRFTTGVIEGVEAIGDVPEQIQIIGGQTLIALGGYFEEAEMVKRGQMNISTAQKNLDATMAKRYDFASPEELESFAYTLGSGAVNYGTMILGGGLGATAKALGAGVKTASTLSSIGSLGTMGAMEAGQEAYERTSKYVTDTGDKTFSEYTPEKANKNLLAEAAYTAGSVALEHMVGFGAQKKIWKLDLNKTKLPSAFKRATIDTVRSGAMTAASETTTEALQSLLNIGIDLADGTMNMAEVPERLQQEMVGWAAASVIGGTAGISAAISHRANGLKYIKQQISDVVPPEDLNSVANTIFDTGANAVADRVSVELELSSELQNKHGAVYDSMQRAIKRAADESGAFKNYTEDEMAEYVSDTSKLFADQVLAEANQRNVNIDDVLKASDIVYEDGGIRLKNKSDNATGGEELKQAMYKSKLDSLKNFVDDVFVNKEDTSARYFANVSKSGVNFDIPRDTILHDKKHALTSFEWAEIAENIDNIEGATISSKKRFDGQPVLMKIATPNGKYGVVFEHMKNGRNIITTAFKDTDANLDNWIKNNSAKAMQTAPTTQKGLLSGRSMSDIISALDENVNNTFEQNSKNPKGSYNPSTGAIKIFETADFSTLPHELAHYWLDNMWNYTRSGNASEQYQQRWNVIANWLNVRPEQTRLTRGQQEKFARGYEQYLLNGDLPTPMIRGAFDDYDRWLKRVYNDINRLNVRLTDDAIRFFQSMTTGKLPAPKLKPMRKKRGKMTLAEKMRERMNIQQQEKQEQEAVNFMNDVEAARPMPDNIVERTVIKSNITEGRTGESRVYNREIEKNIDALSEIAEDNLEYNKVVLAEQAQKANEFVKNNLDEARKIVDGLRPAPENILDTAIRIAYEQEMLRIGDNAEYLRALKLHSSLQTLRGQEISAERISSADITAPEYWINKVIANRTHKVAKRIFGGWKSVGESSLELYKNMIKEETNAITKKVLAEKDVQAQKKVLNEEIKRLKYEYGLDNGQLELFQMPNDQPLNAKNAKMYVNNALDNLFGTTLTQEEADQIIGKVAELEKSISTTLDETGNPSIQTWIKVKEMNNLIESYTPSPALQIATSIVGRGVMLASLKSPTLNIISNTENILAEMIIRRAVNTVEGSATQSAVDRNVVSDYLKYANDVYRYSGYNVSTTQDIDASIVTLGEQRISTQGKGWYRKFARSVETGVFKYLMGYPDSVSKDIVFSDVASLEATTIALNEGKEGAALTKRANELFVDATRVEPTTEEGLLIRDKAIKEANIATYTNDTALSKLALGIRESLNKATGDVRLGDQLMPFVKTPANVVSLGLEYTAGLAYALPKLPKIIRDVKAGKITDESRTAIKAAMRNGLGVVLAMLLSSAFDPEDYTPEYDALSPSERRLALEKGAVFNSVRIGDKYISLDYLGPLALPMAAILTSRYREDNPLWGFTAGALSQAAKTPGVGEIYDAIKFIGDSVRRDAKENVENIGNIMLDYVRARTIPSIVNDLAKVFDDVERETSGGTFDKVQNSLPGFRNLLPEKYQTTSPTPRKTESPFSTLFFGARVKTASNNRVIYEIDRLYKNGNRVTITDVTRSGKLADLSEEKQQKARKEFAKRYYDAAYKLVSSRSYRQKDDEQKAYALNKARRKIIEDLKKELIK